ncbi:MAG TPA: helix-turn-helix domain-containing protein [Candidatus Wunengus sp. YC63]|uniref:helix-turn-helix domain-containing protein n=1 Tax=unclassified Candidatus Wunengus TaxID=3367695 RepID=UPI0027125238|nr:winged helix-turn-helix domain-containing protein [Candidatus Brocadiales bacterium]
MPRTANYEASLFGAAKQAVSTAKTIDELRQALSILLPAMAKITLSETGEILGISRANVWCLQKKFRNRIEGRLPAKSNWGGRRNATMTLEEESDFLMPWVERAKQGGVLIVPPIHTDYEQRIGHKVPKSTVYRLLARHGWRKIEPDQCHPKSNFVAQEEFKKNFQKYWQIP